MDVVRDLSSNETLGPCVPGPDMYYVFSAEVCTIQLCIVELHTRGTLQNLRGS